MPVQRIHCPMEQGLVRALYLHLAMAAHGGVIHAMIVVETDVLAREEMLHPMAQDDVLRHTALQAVLAREKPQSVGEYQRLLDVVCGEQDGLLLFVGETMK